MIKAQKIQSNEIMKEIAPYYPYNLQMWVKEVNEIAQLFTLENDTFKCIIEEEVYSSQDYTILPILHPLSDLTKEIEVNGEMFVPIERIKQSQQHLFYREDLKSDLLGLQYSEMQKLFEWHFDVFDLYSQNLCIYQSEVQNLSLL